MIDWKIGQQVVCINADYTKWTDHSKQWIPNKPIEGSIYTIRSIFPYPWPKPPDTICLHLEELVNLVWPNKSPIGFVEPGFWSARFRPTKETSIEIFEALLKTKELVEI